MKVPKLLARPFLDVVRGEGRCVRRVRDLGWLAIGLAAGWWIYVPVHELLHAFACLATGGEVTRLEIDPLYGGGLLELFIPWVVAGGEYAGRLSSFDTGGSDLVYLATDLGPFLLTLMPGVWLLRRAARVRAVFWFGASLPFALAPLLSLTGDAYEIGSILTTWLPPWTGEAARELLRGDDLLLRARAVAEAGGAEVAAGAASGGLAWSGLVLASLIGVVWAFAVYAVGGWIAARLGQRPLPPHRPGGEAEPAEDDGEAAAAAGGRAAG